MGLTSLQMIFITPREAANLWGSRVYKMSGMTYLWNDGQCESGRMDDRHANAD